MRNLSVRPAPGDFACIRSGRVVHSGIRHGSRRSVRHGAVVALVCVLLPAMLAVMAYCIHVAYAESLHARTQIVSDAIAKTAGREYAMTGNRDATLVAAREAANRNLVGGVEIPVNMGDLEFGISDRLGESSQYQFTPIPADQPRVYGNSIRFTTNSLHDTTQTILPTLFPGFGGGGGIRPRIVAANTQGSMDVAIVLDRSGSMRYAGNEFVGDGSVPPAAQPIDWVPGQPVLPGARWHDTVAAVDMFLRYLDSSPQREQVSLASYATEATTDCRLTYNVSEVSAAMHGITNEFYGGWTAMGKGMRKGVEALTDFERSRRWAVRVMVLMTDGVHNEGQPPEWIVNRLKDNGVMLFTITFGDGADQQRMRDLAASCNGEQFHATNAWQLGVAFGEISRRLPSLMTQ